MLIFFFSSFIFKENHVLVKENKPQKFLIIKEQLDGIDIDDIGNLEDLLRIVFIHEERVNIKVFVDNGNTTNY